MLPQPDNGDAALDRQLFTYLEQLEDSFGPRIPGVEAKPDIRDAALYRQLFTYPLLKQLKNKINLRQRTLLFTDSSSQICYRSS